MSNAVNRQPPRWFVERAREALANASESDILAEAFRLEWQEAVGGTPGGKIATITEQDAAATANERAYEDCGCGDVAQHLADVYEDYEVVPDLTLIDTGDDVNRYAVLDGDGTVLARFHSREEAQRRYPEATDEAGGEL